MDIIPRIRSLSPPAQQELFRRISHVISNRDLTHIMEDVARGISIMRAHQRQDIFRRYTADILRFLDEIEGIS